MANEFWKDSPFGENSIFHPSWEEKKKKEKIDNKENVNMLIVLDASGKNQFDDTKNNIWLIHHCISLAEFVGISSIIKKYSFKNLCLVHHGNVYSDVTLKNENKINFGVERMRQMDKIITAVGNVPFAEQNEGFFKLLQERSLTFYKEGYHINELKAFCCLKGLIQNINSEGNYFSIACDEADDPKLLEKLSNYSSNSIKLFANSNYTVIKRNYDYAGIKNYGSILNSFLTNSKNWLDESGWKYFDKSQNKIIISKKDLWIYSKHKSKIFDLISRKKQLTTEQVNKENYAQTYFSKGFEVQYKKKYGESAYFNYIKTIESKFPEFKQ